MRQLNPPGVAFFVGLYRDYEIQPEQRQVIQVILCERFASEMSVNEAQSAETPGAPAQSADIGKLQMRGISQDHIANDPVAGKQHPDLSTEFP
jgi:hypothetical protein